MQERARIKVDENEIQRMMASDVPLIRAKHIEPAPEIEVKPEPESKPKQEQEQEAEQEQESVSAMMPEIDEKESEPYNVKSQKKRKNSKPNFSETFLKDNKIRDRRQIYISKEAYDKISRYLRYIGEGNVSLVSYVDNILFHHMDDYRDTINDLYNKKISTPL
jgi:hypothetical protein